MGKLGNMINSNQIELGQFFTMHPFSASRKILYSSALEEIDFFKELYIKNNKTYERLAKVCNVFNNFEKNLVVITGYRGCGKTNFLRLIQYISEGNGKLETLEELKNADLNYAKESEDLKNLIQKEYSKSRGNIRNILFNDMYKVDEEEITGEPLVKYIYEHLNGKCKYINFDEAGMGRDKPFSTKLFYSIRESIDIRLREGRLQEIVDLIDDFAKRNQWIIEENFENIDFRTLKNFWSIVKHRLRNFNQRSSYDDILDELKKLALEQLLFVYTIWEYAEILTSNRNQEERKLIYILDNIDIISDGTTDIFQNTMMGIWKFVWDTRNVFAKIGEKHAYENRDFIELYNKTNIIVAMRETTAMHISGHLRDKMREIMDHFDMSADIDKTRIMQKKIDLALSLIYKGDINSQGFIEAIECLDQLSKDRLFMRNLFKLFNDDFRTSMTCITTICIEHMEEVKKAIQLLKSVDGNIVFGGRGIIYRLLIDGFFDWNYFDAIGIPSIKSKGHTAVMQVQHGYSCARSILTILCNKQAKNSERFFINPEESVKLADLYSMVSQIMSVDEFVNIIDGMYSLRNKKFWNHLVTFDNILSYSPGIIKKYIELEEQTEKTDIYIRATSAGQMFVSMLCIHFEYFASRFAAATNNVSLFLLDDLSNKSQWNSMKKIVNDVYEAVKKCVGTLEIYNRKVMMTRGVRHYEDILDSSYYYERQFHEERIIHNQITYLEAYRNYIIHGAKVQSRLTEINDYLLTMIQKYLDLLKYDKNKGIKKYRDTFYTINSENLYNELSVCIEEARNSGNPQSNIEISREYYLEHYKGKKCCFVRDNMEKKNE